MDDANDNIFAERIAGIENPPAINNGKSDSLDSSIAGRIDPAIARSTGEIGEAGEEPGASPAAAGNTPEPATGQQPAAAGKRRGRPPGPAKAREENGEARNIRVSFVEKTLFAIHTGVAAVTKCPEFALEKEDAKMLGEAVAGVLAFHKIRMTPKQEAYAVLMEAAAQVYPPMIVSVYFRKKMEAEQSNKNIPQPPKPVAPFPTAQPVEASLKPNGFDPTKIIMPGS